MTRPKLHGARRRLVELMQRGYTLMWCGDNGPELSGHPFWPQKRTVRSLLRDGVLKCGEPLNRTQGECGIYPVTLADEWKHRELLT
jgi:hypothetical protein